MHKSGREVDFIPITRKVLTCDIKQLRAPTTEELHRLETKSRINLELYDKVAVDKKDEKEVLILLIDKTGQKLDDKVIEAVFRGQEIDFSNSFSR